MLRLARPATFFREVSESRRVKFTLAWLTFGGLALPTALLMSLGVDEKYALLMMLAAILPFQYAVFCVLKGLKHDRSVLAGEVYLSRVKEQMWKDTSDVPTSYLRAQEIMLAVPPAVTGGNRPGAVAIYPNPYAGPGGPHEGSIPEFFRAQEALKTDLEAMIRLQRAALECLEFPNPAGQQVVTSEAGSRSERHGVGAWAFARP